MGRYMNQPYSYGGVMTAESSHSCCVRRELAPLAMTVEGRILVSMTVEGRIVNPDNPECRMKTIVNRESESIRSQTRKVVEKGLMMACRGA